MSEATKTATIQLTKEECQTIKKRFHDYKDFREFLIQAVLDHKNWNLSKDTPLDEWVRKFMAELGYNSRDWYVNWDPCYLTTTYGEDDIYIGESGDDDDVEYPIGRALWHEYLFRAFDEMTEYGKSDEENWVVNAEQTLRIFNKIIPLIEEIEKCKLYPEPDVPIGP
jgi:hypothetical protein